MSLITEAAQLVSHLSKVFVENQRLMDQGVETNEKYKGVGTWEFQFWLQEKIEQASDRLNRRIAKQMGDFCIMGRSIGFYFAGLTKAEVNQVRRRLNELAAELGYIAKGGPTKGQGNAAALMVAIANGEVKLGERCTR